MSIENPHEPQEDEADALPEPVRLNLRGVELRNAGKLGQAIASFSKAVELGPTYADAHTNLGFCQLSALSLDEALASFERAVSAMPDYEPARTGLDVARKALAEIKGMNKAYAKLLGTVPESLRSALSEQSVVTEMRGFPLYSHPTEDSYFLKVFLQAKVWKLAGLEEFDLAISSIIWFLANHPFDGWWGYKVLSWIYTQQGDRLKAQSCAVGKIVGAVPEQLLPLPDRKITSLEALQRGERGFSHQAVDMDHGRERFFFPDTLTLDGTVPEIWRGRQEADLGEPEVTILPRGRACISFSGAAIFNRKGKFLLEISAGDGRLLAMAGKLPKVTKLRGTVLFLADPWSDEFFHWMMETVPRIRIISEAGIPLDSIDHFYVKSIRPYHLEMLGMMGVSEDRLISGNDAPHIRADRLILTSNVNPIYPHYEPRHWACALLRSTVLPHAATVVGENRKIYIARKSGHGRQVLNETGLWKVLEENGYSRVYLEDNQIAEQAAIINHARTIIAPAGAALANLAFASPGTDVLIMYPPSVPWRFYWHLATFVEVRHYFLHGDVEPVSGGREPGWVIDDNSDFSVDLKKVRKFLRLSSDRSSLD